MTLEEWSKPIENHQLHQLGSLKTSDGDLEITQNGLYWSKMLENGIYGGPSDSQVQIQIEELRDRKVKVIDRPDWLHCGREKNRFITFQDDTHACARFRANHAEFVQGEIMAFYLARLLGITNTPAVVLSEVRL